LVAGDSELEDQPGLALALYHLPGAELQAARFTQEEVQSATGTSYWPTETGTAPTATHGWLAFLDPFTMDCERWLRDFDAAYAPRPIIGGLASGNNGEQDTQIYLNGEVFNEGGVAVAVGGEVTLTGVIAQGCTPIGETWTLTGVERNIIHGIANRRAYDVLSDTWKALSTEEQRKTQGNLFIGLVVNEYLDEFHRGDFLVRNVLGADPNSGAIAVGALPRAGQIIQFQRRDAATASLEMAELLARAKDKLTGATILGGCLCCCNGRGKGLFETPSHDAKMVQQQLGPFGLAGFFCNGEIGPVGEKSFLHGNSASLALFVKR
jgi:small ligand-binding sensory domain FIST